MNKMNVLEMMKYPKIDEIKSALFIQPHPDDNEIGAGGTMAYLRSKGVKVFAVTVTKGDGGSDVYSPEELAEIRTNEAKHAAEILDIEYLGNLGFSNSHPGTVEEQCEAIVRVIRECRPHAIISVDPDLANECHPVHVRVGNAVKEAFIRAGQPYYPFHQNKRHDDAFKPSILGQYFTEDENNIVDITAFYDKKIAAIQAHASQIDEAYLGMLDAYYGVIAHGTPYQKVERIKLFNQIQGHCFALSAEIKKQLV